ncbi:alpha-2-macroglobulin [Panacibacter ginsenosidivorans]|uniref:Alpha-2-macroglobulin n=1 Tax=Panacibacter ginsenosidivorans TaxID=1813871 RepID=A0A5B8VF71_9BACT|nr:alpha-2-macroglobulin family protein [Panacibacter ginsenosidivorans]QEC69671.1 alpha-2-macroglobulin [Panacibacter ginsenosidivorans]
MKRLLALFIFIIAAIMSNAQKKDNAYIKQWQEIDTLILSKDLPKTALKKVKLLYADAKAKGIKDQLIKALLYRMSLENDINEENPNVNDALLKAEINAAKDEVQKSILYVLLAYNYENYFDEHAWQFSERSKTINFKKEDVATWSADDFNREIGALYNKALQPAAALQRTSLKFYNAIIIKGNAGNLRPTLYDLIAHKVLDHFKNDNNYITQPDYTFEIKEEAALSTADNFIQHSFKSVDSTSNILKALQLFQQLMQFHKADKDPSALIDVNIERIEWVNEKAVIDEKEALYKTALEEITTKYANNSVAAQAWYLLAKIYADKAGTYKPFGDTTNRYAYIKTKEIINARLKQDTIASEGRSNMLQLQNSINTIELQTQVEGINIPGQPFRMLVNYRNIETMHIRIINASELKKIKLERWDESFWKELSKLSFTKSYTQSLPATKDYQQHATEVKIDALKPGDYAILACSSKNFDPSKDKMILQRFDVSNISYINNGDDYFVLHRETGAALTTAVVKYSVETYDNKKGDYIAGNFITIPVDSNGMFHLPVTKISNRRNTILHFTYGDDTLETRSNDYYRPYNNVQEEDTTDFERRNTKIFFFTDRSIYRPGQIIFFKGIAVTKDKISNRPKILSTKAAIDILLKDVNNKQVDSIEVNLNEYGSFTGKFKIPQNTLTGNFSIVAETLQGFAGISVEEYKRPKFYVEFDTLKSAYKLNDTIIITGYAKSYAGNVMDNATVKFNVQRNTRFLYPWMFWKISWPRGNAQQIADGIIKTDATGKFEISFIAKPDNSIDKATEPVFDFSIEAAVTDMSGETREGKSSVSVGYKSLQLSVAVPATAELNEFKEIAISAKNLSGQNVPTDVNISIAPLQSPAKIYRERLWDQPDQFSLSKNEFEKAFPYDLYENESDHRNWQKKEVLVSETLNTEVNSKFKIQNLKLGEGWYVIEATAKDKEGNAVKDVQYIQLYNKDSSVLASKETAWSNIVAASVQPGEQAKLLIGSSYENVNLILNTDYKSTPQSDTSYYAFYKLNNQKQLYSYSVKEADRNGLGIWYAFVKNNRFYTGGTSIEIPYINKDLQIDYNTYRNKTEPGSEEKWTVTVKGDDKEKATAELLTAMYDASLDQFKPHSWYKPDVWSVGYSNNNWSSRESFKINNSQPNYLPNNIEIFYTTYNRLAIQGEDFWGENYFLQAGKVRTINQVGYANDIVAAPMAMKSVPGSGDVIRIRGAASIESNATPLYIIDGVPTEKNINEIPPDDILSVTVLKNEQAIALYGAKASNGVVIITTKSGSKKDEPQIQPRKNFNETAFFFPQLHADTAGNYTFSFTMPEALTQWKWLSFAHTKELAFGLQQQTIVTQKTLMVQPNLPRFLREGDKVELTARISNLSDSALTGTASLQLFDAITNQPVDGLFQSVFPDQYFTAEAKQSTAIKFPVTIPFNYNKPLTIKIIASAKPPSPQGEGRGDEVSDGEENTIPVLTNRMLVTETLPLYMPGEGSKEFKFKKLLNNTSPTLTNESITVEYTPQPVWYAVQALPYVMEYPYECAEQTFNRFYANALAAFIVAKHPGIKEVFEKWKTDTTALISNLEKNQELKQILLNETPWVLDAANETQQRKNIALLFDVVNMSSSMDKALQELQQMQMDNGAFPWFKGGYADRYITQYILTGIGRLKKLGALNTGNTLLQEIETKALQYPDLEIAKDKTNIKEKDLKNDNLGSTQIQYLYMRSFFNDNKINDAAKPAQKYYQQQAEQYWNKQSNYLKAMIAAALYRSNEQTFADKNIIPSILENAVVDSTKGMYWKNNPWGYYWYQSPIEQQALMIELMHEMLKEKDNEAISTNIKNMQTWLLLNKQTNNWKTTKATADACYALLLAGSGLQEQPLAVSVNLGDYSINSVEKEQQSGTGYFKERINGADVKPEMGNIYVGISNPLAKSATNPPSWGAVYWQYFEDLDKITSAETPLNLHKKLFIEKNSSTGKILQPVNDNDELHVGDKVVMQIILKSDRDMEYLHLKDMRAASMEPANVLSGYKWQDGLGYYESTKDASTDFFISYLPKGTYVFEYPAYITHTGNFSVGVANIQCMYAPEFNARSEGIRINVENAGQ